MELAKIIIEDWGTGLVCEHNMPCSICVENKAVYQMNSGIFYPCWRCQKLGAQLRIRKNTVNLIRESVEIQEAEIIRQQRWYNRLFNWIVEPFV